MNKKKEIFDCIESYIREKGYSPTVREIGKAVGLHSTSAVSYHLQRLCKDGQINYTPGVSRSITICKEFNSNTTKFDHLVAHLQEKGGPLDDRTKMAAFLARVQLSDTRDPMEWLECLSKPAKEGERL